MSSPPLSDPDQLPLASQAALMAPQEAQWPRVVMGAGAVVYGLMIVFAVGSGTFELVEAIPLIPILAWATQRMARRIARADDDPSVVPFLMAAFSAKLLGTLLRAAVVAWYYNNRSDALDYHRYGQAFATQFRSFDFSGVKSLSGTDFMRTFTGFIYTFTGSSQVSGAIVMSFLSFLGGVLLWRGFRLAVPDGLTRRFALLVLFLPSLLYWPSALGKEGWAMFCLGLASYGVARVTTGSIPSGVLYFALGLVGVGMLRPHVALTMFCGVALAGLVGKSRRPGGTSGVLRIVLFGVLLIAGFVLASSTAEFFGVPSLTTETVNQTLANAEGRTSEAGSSFTPVNVSSNPALFPVAVVTVLFRPLPFEVSNVVAGASAFEGVFLIWLTWKARRRLMAVPRYMRRAPFIAYCVGITFTFIYAFSAFSNFGILARQRCQVLPFYLALLCLPEWRREGVISAQDAVAQRDAPTAPVAEVTVVDPYASSPTSSDPYAQEPMPDAPVERPGPYPGDDWDPYARFRADGRA
ncbi:MAG: hypothetical protein ACXV8T_11390 [Acidimicrobiia bacterium]